MSIQFGCQCGQTLTVRDEFAGKQIRCPQCQTVLMVPDVPGAPSLTDAPSDSAPIAGLPPVQPPGAPVPQPSAPASSGAEHIDVAHLPPVQAWSYAKASDFTLIALTRDALWVADKNEVDLPNFTQYLNGGGDPTAIFAERGLRIGLETLHMVEADKHGIAVEVQYQLGDRRAMSHLDFASQADRNVFFSSMQARLGHAFEIETEQVPAWKAGLKPLAYTLLFGFITLMFYLGSKQLIAGETEAQIRGSRKVLKLIAYWIVDFLGPNGVLIVGSLLVIAGVIWFVMRAQTPPLLVRLKRPEAPGN